MAKHRVEGSLLQPGSGARFREDGDSIDCVIACGPEGKDCAPDTVPLVLADPRMNVGTGIEVVRFG